MNLTPIRAAIVDLDGTIVDTLGDFNAALNGMLGELQLPSIAPDVIQNMVGKGSEHLIISVLQHVLTEAGEADVPAACKHLYPAAWAHYQEQYLAINGQFAKVYPGVVDGLRAMQAQGWALACLTNKPTAFARPLLERKGLNVFFRHVFGGDAFEHKKPDPLPLLKTCEALGQLPAHTLMVGDSSNDAKAARAAGCPVVLVTYGYNHGEPIEAVDADGFVPSLAQLLK